MFLLSKFVWRNDIMRPSDCDMTLITKWFYFFLLCFLFSHHRRLIQLYSLDHLNNNLSFKCIIASNYCVYFSSAPPLINRKRPRKMSVVNSVNVITTKPFLDTYNLVVYYMNTLHLEPNFGGFFFYLSGCKIENMWEVSMCILTIQGRR